MAWFSSSLPLSLFSRSVCIKPIFHLSGNGAISRLLTNRRHYHALVCSNGCWMCMYTNHFPYGKRYHKIAEIIEEISYVTCAIHTQQRQVNIEHNTVCIATKIAFQIALSGIVFEKEKCGEIGNLWTRFSRNDFETIHITHSCLCESEMRWIIIKFTVDWSICKWA